MNTSGLSPQVRFIRRLFAAAAAVLFLFVAVTVWGQNTPTSSTPPVSPAASSSENDNVADAPTSTTDEPPTTGAADGAAFSTSDPAPFTQETSDATGTAQAAKDSAAGKENTQVAGSAEIVPATEGPATAKTRTVKNPMSYGLWVLLPPLVAIFLAVFTRQVVPALVMGVLVGAYMMLPCLGAGSSYATMNPAVGGLRLAAETYVMGAIYTTADHYGHLKIIIFTLVIGFMVGVIGRNGGTAGLVTLVAGNTNSPRRGALTAWLAGIVVFFDDYANTMIVGPTMRPVFDRLRISRAKLAYIVDSTAAPVASLALIGTWVGAEITYIQTGLDTLAAGGAAPAFLLTDQGGVVTGMQAFISSLPYRFYPILALFLVFLLCLTGRDFGPMKKSEARARAGEDDRVNASIMSQTGADDATPRWWLGLIPVLLLVAVTVVILILTGYHASHGAEIMQEPIPLWQKAYQIISGSDSYLAIFYGAILSAFAAVLVTMLSRACSVRDATEAGLEGMSRMFPAIVILVLAWALSQVAQELMLGEVVKEHLQAMQFPPVWLPLVVFIASAGISFATGSSWGTMGILCPVTVTIAAHLCADLDPHLALPLFFAAIGSVLSGSVFGDHCSPISDTTVLSSLASGCPHEEHVWTQIPYALVAAIASMGLGDVLCSVYHQPWYYGLAAGSTFLLLFVAIFGRSLKPARPAPPPVVRVPLGPNAPR